MSAPDGEMMALATRVKRFIATANDAELDGLFARDATIIENFAPYIFKGESAVETWRTGMREHTRTLSDLVFKFGLAHDFGVTGDRAYFVLPITWTGKLRGRPFEELGGASFILQRGKRRLASRRLCVVGHRNAISLGSARFDGRTRRVHSCRSLCRTVEETMSSAARKMPDVGDVRSLKGKVSAEEWAVREDLLQPRIVWWRCTAGMT